ncbi:SCP-like protein [Ostertagia ostertagi]
MQYKVEFQVLLLIQEGTPGQFEYILPLLNNYRTNIATGQAWKHRGMLPSSSKMFALKYDSFLELYAQYNTAGCETSNMIPPGGSMNFYKIYGLPTDYDNATVVPLAFATWTQPVLRHEIDDQITYANTNLETFANMAYYKSTHVGCAYQACPTSQPPAHAVACVFDSA